MHPTSPDFLADYRVNQPSLQNTTIQRAEPHETLPWGSHRDRGIATERSSWHDRSDACGVRKLDHAADLGIHREVGDPQWALPRLGECVPEAGAADGIRRGARRRDSA